MLELQSQLKFLKKYLDKVSLAVFVFFLTIMKLTMFLWIKKVQDKAEFVPADLITEKKASAGKSRSILGVEASWKRCAVLFLAAVAGGLVVLNVRQQSSGSEQSAVLLMD